MGFSKIELGLCDAIYLNIIQPGAEKARTQGLLARLCAGVEDGLQSQATGACSVINAPIIPSDHVRILFKYESIIDGIMRWRMRQPR